MHNGRRFFLVRAGVPRRVSLHSWGLFLPLLLVSGCNGPSAGSGFERYVPDSAESRRALESILNDWRQAALPADPAVDRPGLRFVDQQRKPGLRLRSFEILAENQVENVRQFLVRLQFEGPAPPELVRYDLFGREPIWVYRDEDYQMISHWEHRMDEPASGDTPAPR